MTTVDNSIPADVGLVPWSADDLRESVHDFSHIYAQQPIENNSGGMQFNHCFAVWFVLQRLQPTVVVESGVYKGQGTWMIEQACPSARLVALDINLSRLEWRSEKAVYLEKDFMRIDWSDRDLSDAIVVFDDHQNAYRRMLEIYWAGCRRAIFEDNYPVDEGDCYSPRRIFAGVGHPRIQGSRKYQKFPGALRNSFLQRILRQRRIFANQSLIVDPNQADRGNLSRRLESYYEIPPAYLPDSHRTWGLPYKGAYAARPALLENAPQGFDGDYGYICYLALK
jgi:hypothetical protein